MIECGIQATGGNFSFFTEIPDLTYAGFPLAEIHADGSSVITKHQGTGGLASVEPPPCNCSTRSPAHAMPTRTSPPGWTPSSCPRRRRSGADQRRSRRTTAADAEGLAEQHRRFSQHDDIRVDRPGHRSEGRFGAPPTGGLSPPSSPPSWSGRWPAPTTPMPTPKKRPAPCFAAWSAPPTRRMLDASSLRPQSNWR